MLALTGHYAVAIPIPSGDCLEQHLETGCRAAHTSQILLTSGHFQPRSSLMQHGDMLVEIHHVQNGRPTPRNGGARVCVYMCGGGGGGGGGGGLWGLEERGFTFNRYS